MAQYIVDGNGNKKIVSRFNKTGVLNSRDIFPDDPKTTGSLIKKTGKQNLEKTYNVVSKSHLVRSIMSDLVFTILDRVAEGDTFVFPGSTGAYITLKKTPQEEVKRMRKEGLFKDIDIIRSGLQIPRFIFDFGPKYSRKDRGIYVPPRLLRKAFKSAENRLLSWVTFPKRLSYDNKVR